MTEHAVRPPPPPAPFPGIEPFTYAYRGVFSARQNDVKEALRLVMLYRGVLLYGASQRGKSSLLNAGLIPEALEHGFQPERIRIQPRRGAECIVDRIAERAHPASGCLPSIFEPLAQRQPQSGSDVIVISLAELSATVRAAATVTSHPGSVSPPTGEIRPLLIFDQFEEWVTAFEEAQAAGDSEAGREAARDAAKLQLEVVDAIADLVNDHTLRVKVLLAFREDYLPRFEPFFLKCATLSDHYLRLAPLEAATIGTLIRTPFEAYPGHYRPELAPAVVSAIERQFSEGELGSEISLTSLQIVCREVFEKPWLAAELKPGGAGIRGVLRGYFETRLLELPEAHRDPAVAILTSLVTAAGTRRTLDRDSLLTLANSDQMASATIYAETLEALENGVRLIRREVRRDVAYFEIASEFLVDWIKERAAERRTRQEQIRLIDARSRAEAEAAHIRSQLLAETSRAEAERLRAEAEAESARTQKRLTRRFKRLAVAAAALLLVAAVLLLAAISSENEQVSRLLAEAANTQLSRNPKLSARLGLRATELAIADGRLLPIAAVALHRAVRSTHLVHEVRQQGTWAVLDAHDTRLALVSNDGKRLEVRGGRFYRSVLGEFDSDTAIVAAAFRPDGGLLVASADGSLDRFTFGPPSRTRIVAGAHLRSLRGTATSAHLDAVVFGSRAQVVFTGSDQRGQSDAANRTGSPYATYATPRRWVAVLRLTDSQWDSDTTIDDDQVSQLLLSDDGERILTIRSDGIATVSKVDGSRLARRAFERGSAIFSSPDGEYVLVTPPPKKSVAAGTIARLWDVGSGKVIDLPMPARGDIAGVTFSADKLVFAVVQKGGLAQVWRIAPAGRGQAAGFSVVFTAPVEALGTAFSQDSRDLITWTADHSAQVWRLDSGDQVLQLAGHDDGIVQAAATSRVVVTVAGTRVNIWNRDVYDTAIDTGYRDRLEALALSADGQWVAVGGANMRVTIADAADGVVLDDVAVGSPVSALAYGSERNVLAIGTAAGRVLLYENHRLRDVAQSSGAVRAVGFARNAASLVYVGCSDTSAVSGQDPCVARVVNVADGRVISETSVPGRALSLTIAGDESAFEVATLQSKGYTNLNSGSSVSDAQLTVLHLPLSSTPIGAREPSASLAPTAAAAAQEGASGPGLSGSRRASVTAAARTLAYRVTREGNQLSRKRGNTNDSAVPFEGAESLAISPDGSHFAAGGEDGRVHLYATEAPMLPVVLDRPSSTAWEQSRRITALQFSDDGHTLASLRQDGVVTVYPVGIADLRRFALAAADSLQLSIGECAQHIGDLRRCSRKPLDWIGLLSSRVWQMVKLSAGPR